MGSLTLQVSGGLRSGQKKQRGAVKPDVRAEQRLVCSTEPAPTPTPGPESSTSGQSGNPVTWKMLFLPFPDLS